MGTVAIKSLTTITASSPKGVVILTAATPADIGTIIIPAGITRYLLLAGTVIAETASGTLASASVTLFDAPNGTGNALSQAATLPAGTSGTSSRVSILVTNPATAQSWSTSPVLYVHQTANSANAGTCTFYVTIFPIS